MLLLLLLLLLCNVNKMKFTLQMGNYAATVDMLKPPPPKKKGGFFMVYGINLAAWCGKSLSDKT